MMPNGERCIIMALISELYEYRIFDHGLIPIDTDSWMDTYVGMGIGELDESELAAKYDDVLRLATENFQNHMFRLRFPEREQDVVKGPYKVYLEFTKHSIWPEEQC